MYDQLHGLRKNPFAMSPDPALLYLSVRHREALAGLLHAVLSAKGLAVLTGEAGTGKTTLLRRVLRDLPADRIPSSIIFNPSLSPDELLEMALCEFGVTDLPAGRVQRLIRFRTFLLDAHAHGRVPLLAIDEAQTLSPALLEQVRLLSNFELADAKLLQIVLLGQSELSVLLDDPALRQLKQRVAIRLSVEPFSPAEVESCIRFRWRECGGAGFPFDRAAIEAVAGCSGGIPRLINSLCDNALLNAFGSGGKAVTEQHVYEAATDLHLKRAAIQPQAEELPPVLSSIRVFERYGQSSHGGLLGRWAARMGF